MSFDGTPTNVSEILVIALAVTAVSFLMRKRYNSNLPLLFYAVAVGFTNVADRPVSPFLMYGGLALALLLRFEFMNNSFSKVIAFLATGSMMLIIVVFLVQVFGNGTAFL